MSTSFEYKKYVEFADTDMAGIVHFANFFRYMEMAEHALWRSLDLPLFLRSEERNTISWPRVKAECDYLSPLRFGDEVTVRVSIESVNQSSIHIKHDFIIPQKNKEARTIAKGRIVVVCASIAADGQSVKSVPVPDRVREKLS